MFPSRYHTAEVYFGEVQVHTYIFIESAVLTEGMAL